MGIVVTRTCSLAFVGVLKSSTTGVATASMSPPWRGTWSDSPAHTLVAARRRERIAPRCLPLLQQRRCLSPLRPLSASISDVHECAKTRYGRMFATHMNEEWVLGLLRLATLIPLIDVNPAPIF